MNSRDLVLQSAVDALEAVRPRRFVTVHRQVRADAAGNDDAATANLEHGQSPL